MRGTDGRTVTGMADIEKVKQGLKFHISPYCDTKDRTCPYWLNQYCGAKRKNCEKNLAVDALSVIEQMEQEIDRKEGHWIVLEFCANEGIYCSECHMKIFDRTTKPKEKLSKYCPHCGSRNEQFFMDGKVVFR